MKSGRIFEEIVLAFVKSTTEHSPVQRNNCWAMECLIKTHNYDCLERELRLEETVLVGVAALREALESEFEQHLPRQYENYVLYGKGESVALQFSGPKMQQKYCNVVLYAMNAMHDAWAQEHFNNLENCAAIQQLDDQFKRWFVPLAFLGWKLAKRYYLAVLALLDGNQPEVTETEVMAAYKQKAQLACREQGIQDAQNLQAQIMKGAEFYHVLVGPGAELFTRERSAKRLAKLIAMDMAWK